MDTLKLEITFDSSNGSQARVWFVCINQGYLMILEYKIRYLEWLRKILMIYTLEHDMVYRFIRQLSLLLSFLSKHLIARVYFFYQVINHERAT